MKKIRFISKLIKEEKIKLTSPSNEISKSYIEKSSNSLKASKILNNQNLVEESVSMSYYSMFHISLSLFYKIGIKCENHNAIIILLKELFNIDNYKISFAKEERIDKQYYIDFKITKDDSKILIEIAEEFNSEIYNFIQKLSNNNILEFNNKFKNTYFKVENE